MDELMQFVSDMGAVWSRYGGSILRGAWTTILLAVICTVLGCVIGFAVGTVQANPVSPRYGLVRRVLTRVGHGLLRAYVEFFRGTPLMLQAMFIFYGAAYAFGLHMETFSAGIFILSINTGAYMAETVRGGILAIDRGQIEGAKAIGMTHRQAMLHVVLPQTLRNLLPQIGNNFIINLKDSSMLSVISVTELFFSFKSAAAALYLYFPAATIAMILYLCMTLVSAYLLRLWERKMTGKANYELAENLPVGANEEGGEE
ncbi:MULTISPECIES: amino acid ABC transporter permease [unclassified Flavonifractor]|uniref:amino acid ABC transporter permease n=1 Tax=unclassified Flavonifractor TaxID=2629267 RepID=UPI001FA8BFFA|nr:MULTISPECIES: amino acid ABC transporter permease [unclassified Flavonifractor]